jgi:hypothetical protein
VIAPEGAEFTLLTGGSRAARRGSERHASSAAALCGDAGRLEAVSGSTCRTRTPPWVAPGLVARLEWEIVNVLVLEISGEILFPLVRDRFYVNSDTTLFRTSAVAGGGAAGLGVRFP